LVPVQQVLELVRQWVLVLVQLQQTHLRK